MFLWLRAGERDGGETLVSLPSHTESGGGVVKARLEVPLLTGEQRGTRTPPLLPLLRGVIRPWLPKDRSVRSEPRRLLLPLDCVLP